jgi:hypothetical protein
MADKTVMKAIVQDTYGSADVLELRDIGKPWPARVSWPPARRKRPGRNIARARQAAPAGLDVG